MLFRLMLLFVGIPILEMALLVRIGQDLGFWPTIGIIVFTGVLGSILTRQQGTAVWHQFNTRLQSGQLPDREIIDGLIVLVSGALLLTPGVLTDFVGFLGLLPPTRSLMRTYAQKRIKSAQATGSIKFRFDGFGTQSPPPPQPTSNPEWQGQGKDRPDYAE